MAFQDNDYVKAPYLQVGDYLKINGTTSGFSLKSGNTGFLYGTNGGTLTMGEEGVPASLPVLNINAQEINWNGRPLEEYFVAAGENSDELDELSTRVDDLQKQFTTEVAELKETDATLTSGLETLRLESLGASVNILQNPLNNFVSNICGIVIPVSSVQAEMSSFNTIRLGGIRNSISCYVSIYHSISTTPSVDNSSQFTLLHKDATLIEASGTDSSQVSVDIRLSKNVSVPSSGILLVLFSTSRDDPSNTGIDWIIDTAVNAKLKLSVYAVSSSSPTSSNGVWILQKGNTTSFLTYVPDVQIAFVGRVDDALSYVDSELREKIDTLETGYDSLDGRVDTLESNSRDYMTLAETNEAIDNYRSVVGGIALGSLMPQLTTDLRLHLEKDYTEFTFDTAGINLYTSQSGEHGISNLNFTYTGVNILSYANSYTGIYGLYLKDDSVRLSHVAEDPYYPYHTTAQLALSFGKLEMHLTDTTHSVWNCGFDMEASIPEGEGSGTAMYMRYYVNEGSDRQFSELFLNPHSAELHAGTDGVYTNLSLSQEACRLDVVGNSWDGLLATTSNAIPTVSVVHYLIQSALANQ